MSGLMDLNAFLAGLHRDLGEPPQPAARVKKEETAEDGKGGDVKLIINMAVKIEPVDKEEDFDWSQETLPEPKHEQKEEEEEDEKPIKLEEKGEESDTTIVDDEHQYEDSGSECGCPHPEDVESETEIEDEDEDEEEEDDDVDSDSDSDDDEVVIPVKDTLKRENVDQMLIRCDLILGIEKKPVPDAHAVEWPMDVIKLQKRINKMRIFSDNGLNERVKEILLMDDSQRCMMRAVQHLAFVFWDKKNFQSSYLPQVLTQWPEIRSGIMPLRNYKLFYAVFMHLLSFTSMAKFEASPFLDSIAGEVGRWQKWFLFAKGRGAKKVIRPKSPPKKTVKRARRMETSDEDDEDEDFAEVRKRCRKRLNRQPDRLSLNKEIRWPRVYDLKGSIKQEAKVFNDRQLNRLLVQLLLTKKSRKSLSGAVDNLGRVFWSRDEIRHFQFPAPQDLLNPKLQKDVCLPHADKFYEIFMRIQGKFRCLKEFATSRWAIDVYKSFRFKFV